MPLLEYLRIVEDDLLEGVCDAAALELAKLVSWYVIAYPPVLLGAADV